MTQKDTGLRVIYNTLVNYSIIDPSEYGNNYSPDIPITRAEMAKMIVRALGLDDEETSREGQTEFADDKDIDSSDREYAILAVENKIINGYPDNTFKPDGFAKRAEAAAMLVNMLSVIVKPSETNTGKEDNFIEPVIEVQIDDDPTTAGIFRIWLANVSSYNDFNYILIN